MRLLLLLEEVAKVGTPVSPAALSTALDLPRPTVHRLLHTAETEGFLQRDLDGRTYGPGRRLRRLASNTLSSHRVRTERLRILKRLTETIGETCNISVPGRDGMVYLERVETHWPLRIQLQIGTQVPFHCTASGKMYLSTLRQEKLDRLLATITLDKKTDHTIVSTKELKAELAETRKRGYSTDDEEFMDGMAAIAVAVEDDQSRLLSTISVHAPVLRHDINALRGQLDELRQAASDLRTLAIE